MSARLGGDGTGMAGAAASLRGIFPASQAHAVQPASVLVGIPALNEERHIEPCLRSLLDRQPGMDEVRVVVADGGSGDRTREIVESLRGRYPNLVLIDNPGRLQSAALNLIVERCAAPQHRFLVRCDAHAIYPPGYVLAVAGSLAAREAEAVATPMDSLGQTALQKAIAWVSDSRIGSGGSAHRGGRWSGYVDHGHHAGIRLDWFRRIGGYDPTFSHNEDAEFDHRLRSAGGRIWLDAEIRLAYRPRSTLRGLARQYWSYGRGRARTLISHGTRPRLRQVLPVVNMLGLLAATMVAPFWPAALVFPLLYLGLLLATSLWMAVRHRDAAGLLAGPAVGIMHLAWGAGFLWQAATRRSAAWLQPAADAPSRPAPAAPGAALPTPRPADAPSRRMGPA